MTLPSNVRSLFACGVFCAVGGAWLTLVTEIRTLPLRSDSSVAIAAPAPAGEPLDTLSIRVQNARVEPGDEHEK
jgi:hypothetical protein